MLLYSEDRVTHWSFDMRPADILVMPPSTEHDGIFRGAAAYAAIRLDLAEVTSLFKGEPRLSDPAAWINKSHHRADPSIIVAATRRLPKMVSHLARHQGELSDAAADFWKRSIMDAVSGTIMHALPPDCRGPLPSAMQLVGKVDDYLDAAGLRPVHISEICAHLNVTRRTLHRAFFDALGLGPITFLRYKRLCVIHSVLRDSDPATTTVAQVAIQHGFIELGSLLGLLSFVVRGISFGNTRPPPRAGQSEVEVTRHGRRALVLMSAERCDWTRVSAVGPVRRLRRASI
jgi:AraC family ethanolamine operon transcriptional activator